MSEPGSKRKQLPTSTVRSASEPPTVDTAPVLMPGISQRAPIHNRIITFLSDGGGDDDSGEETRAIPTEEAGPRGN